MNSIQTLHIYLFINRFRTDRLFSVHTTFIQSDLEPKATHPGNHSGRGVPPHVLHRQRWRALAGRPLRVHPHEIWCFWIQVIHLFQYMCSLGIKPTTFALLTQCSNHWATGTTNILLKRYEIKFSQWSRNWFQKRSHAFFVPFVL